MAEIVELQLFDGGDDLLGIVTLVEHAKSKHENGIGGINAGQRVVAAFVDIDDVVAKAAQRRLGRRHLDRECFCHLEERVLRAGDVHAVAFSNSRGYSSCLKCMPTRAGPTTYQLL
jgi:hypothetical protein